MIKTVNENQVVAYRIEPGPQGSPKPVILASATRLRPGALWSIWYREHMKDGSHRETVHARVSGKLPADLQSRMIIQLLDLADH